MPLDVHLEAQHALTAALSAELTTIEVQNNSFLVHRSTAGLLRLNAILPNATSKIGQRIASILGDEPFSDFVYDQLSIQLRRQPFSGDAPAVPLTSIEGFENSELLAAELVSQFESLPWSYSLFTSIPYEIGQRLSAEMPEREYALNDSYRLIRFADNDAEYPSWPNERRGLLPTPTEDRFSTDLLYLNGHLSGYIGRYQGLGLIDDFNLAVKAFFGIGIAQRVFKPTYNYFFGERTSSAIVFRRQSDCWKASEPFDFDSGTAKLLHSIGPA